MAETLEVLFPGGKRVDVDVGGFRIATDQAVKNGGGARRPSLSRSSSPRWRPVPASMP